MKRLFFLICLPGLLFSQEKVLLITGIAGFIGYHAAIEANFRGYQVIGIDNFNSYYDPSLKRERAKRLESQGVVIFEADLCDEEKIRDIFNRFSFSGVIHLAGQAGVRASREMARSYIDSNIVGTWALLEMNREKKIPFIIASSSSVYGNSLSFPTKEIDSTDTPLSLYAASKKSIEAISFSYASVYQIPITCLRFFSVYGPWGRPDMAYYSFTKKIASEMPIIVYGDGTLLRDLTYVDDIVQGIFLSLEKAGGYHIYNLGRGEPHTTREIISAIEENLNRKAQILWQDKPVVDAEKTHADISKAKAELGYDPKVSLHEGMQNFLQWIRQYEGI